MIGICGFVMPSVHASVVVELQDPCGCQEE